MVEQPPGGCHNDINAAAQLIDLRIDADATVDDGGAVRQVPPVIANALANLRGQFPGGSEDQRAYPAPIDGAPLEALQQRQGKGSSLARARLGSGQDIPAFQNKRNGLLLDRGGYLITLFLDRTQQFGRKAKLIK
jgi:hypothetical protein